LPNWYVCHYEPSKNAQRFQYIFKKRRNIQKTLNELQKSSRNHQSQENSQSEGLKTLSRNVAALYKTMWNPNLFSDDREYPKYSKQDTIFQSAGIQGASTRHRPEIRILVTGCPDSRHCFKKGSNAGPDTHA
jgi:hypothetical protein